MSSRADAVCGIDAVVPAAGVGGKKFGDGGRGGMRAEIWQPKVLDGDGVISVEQSIHQIAVGRDSWVELTGSGVAPYPDGSVGEGGVADLYAGGVGGGRDESFQLGGGVVRHVVADGWCIVFEERHRVRPALFAPPRWPFD